MESLNYYITSLKVETKSLEEDIKKEHEEFDMLTEALADKDKEIVKMQEDKQIWQQSLTTLEKEIDKLKVKLHRQELIIASHKPPESAEVCLSARSFSEEMLISLRDEDIEAKGKQINLLTDANTKLLVNLDTVEESIEKMQQDILDKNINISKLESVIRKKDAEISAKDHE